MPSEASASSMLPTSNATWLIPTSRALSLISLIAAIAVASRSCRLTSGAQTWPIVPTTRGHILLLVVGYARREPRLHEVGLGDWYLDERTFEDMPNPQDLSDPATSYSNERSIQRFPR
jgi:hypothetical protein